MKTKLWEAIRNGNSAAMKTLYQECYQELYVYGFRILPDREKVQDSLHEIFANIWLKRDTIGQVDYVDAYLKTSLRNNLIRELSKSKNFSNIDETPSVQLPMELSYEQLLIESQFIEAQKYKISVALDKLTPTQKEIIKLKFYDGLNYETISAQLNLKPRTVYNHVYAAICTLKAELST